ncbi:MAG: hypothetical protein RJB62_392, partial [Pseudomonadota bacterium]|jgi:hypothetical protein
MVTIEIRDEQGAPRLSQIVDTATLTIA